MTKELFVFLHSSIPFSTISVSNTQEETMYYFEIPINEDIVLVSITASYAYTSTNNIYAKYQVFLDSILVAEGFQPFFQDKNTRTSKTTKQIETLLKRCSRQVIAQEKQSQKINMIKTFLNAQQNTYS